MLFFQANNQIKQVVKCLIEFYIRAVSSIYGNLTRAKNPDQRL